MHVLIVPPKDYSLGYFLLFCDEMAFNARGHAIHHYIVPTAVRMFMTDDVCDCGLCTHACVSVSHRCPFMNEERSSLGMSMHELLTHTVNTVMNFYRISAYAPAASFIFR